MKSSILVLLVVGVFGCSDDGISPQITETPPEFITQWGNRVPVEGRLGPPDRVVALRFDGADDFVSIPYNSSFPWQVFTAAAWIRPHRTKLRAFILAPGEDDFNDLFPWGLYITTDGTFAVQIGDSGDFQEFYDSGVQVSDNQWHHVAASRSPDAELILYVDGLSVLTVPTSLLPTTEAVQEMTMGCVLAESGPPPPSGQPPHGFFKGYMDAVVLYNRVVSPSEIVSISLGVIDERDPSLFGWWKLDDGVGQMVTDSSENQNDGVLGFSMAKESFDPDWRLRRR